MVAKGGRYLMALLVAFVMVGCSQSASDGEQPAGTSTARTDVPALDPAGWTDTVYERLTDAIARGAGEGKIAVFDFDNTTQARDISEAVLAQMETSGAVDPQAMPTVLFPPFTASDGTEVNIGEGLVNYYQAVVSSAPNVDPLREYSSLTLITQPLTGQTVADYVELADAAYDSGSARNDLNAGTESKIGEIGRPFIYPQMADLYGNLRANGYEVWIVSAGVSWGVRWMVQNALNPVIIQKYGPEAALPLSNVVAITPLMRDLTTGNLVSDYQLTRGAPDDAYVNLDPERLAQIEILALPAGVSSWRGGKRAATADDITFGDVYLAAGDSNGDIPELGLAENRLAINRMNKPELATVFADAIAEDPSANWMLQPTLSAEFVGFLPTECAMAERTAADPGLTTTTQDSLRTLEGTGRLGSFTSC